MQLWSDSKNNVDEDNTSANHANSSDFAIMNPRPAVSQGEQNQSMAVMNGQGCGEGGGVEQEPGGGHGAGEAAHHQPGSDHHDEHQVGKALIGRTSNNQISDNLENMVKTRLRFEVFNLERLRSFD